MQYTEGHLMDNRYVLKRFIGSGSFGEVWLADDKATDLEVAIKIYISMDSEGLSDFKKEFQLSFNLNHTNLLHANYLGVNTQDNRPYLVMPFCPDGSVSKYAGKMDEKDLWRFIRDVASGLAYLHEQTPPIIHQDIKPDNILILKNGEYVISDFGISKQLKSSMRKSAMQMNNSTGSIAYMGPERFSKQYMAVKASDIWSLGVTIYELVYNDMPFCGYGGSLQRQGADIPDLPEEFSKEIKLLFTSCLAKETWNRPSARQIMDFANHYMSGEQLKVTWNYVGPKEFLPDNYIEENGKVLEPGIESRSSNVDMKQTVIMQHTKSADNSFAETQIINKSIDNATQRVETEQNTENTIMTKSVSESKALPIWSYIVTSILGLLVGIMLKIYL